MALIVGMFDHNMFKIFWRTRESTVPALTERFVMPRLEIPPHTISFGECFGFAFCLGILLDQTANLLLKNWNVLSSLKKTFDQSVS